MIDPVATRLGVPLENVYANTILFDDAVTLLLWSSTRPSFEKMRAL